MNVFGAVSGFLIIALFVVCAIYLGLNKERVSYGQETMSSIASNPKYTNWVRFFCWSVSILVIPYLLGLSKTFDLEITSPTISLGILSSFGLFVTALTIDKPASLAHQVASLVFYFSLAIMPLALATKLMNDTKYNLIGYAIIGLFIIMIVVMVANFIKERGKPDGFTEAIFMGGNSAWVIIYSILMLVK